MAIASLPTVGALGPLVLQALESFGGTGSTAEIRAAVDSVGGFSAEELAVKHKPEAPGSELHYRLRWALVDLRRRGLIERKSPRTWSLVRPSSSDSHG